MIIRNIRNDDKDKIQLFFDAMGEQSSSFFNVNHGNEKRTMEFFENSKPDHIFWVADEETEISGLAFIWDLNKSVPWFGIAVADKYQRKGIGSALICEVLSYLKKSGYGGLMLRTSEKNAPAQKLYEKHGFEKVGIHPSGEYLYLKRWDLSV